MSLGTHELGAFEIGTAPSPVAPTASPPPPAPAPEPAPEPERNYVFRPMTAQLVTRLPPPPSRRNPVNFNVRADAFNDALLTFCDELNRSTAGDSAAGLAQYLADEDADKGAALIGFRNDLNVRDCLDLALNGVAIRADDPQFAGGVDATGATDSLAAITAAVAALPATGGTVLLPCGTIKTSPITPPAYPKRVRLIGAGCESTVLTPAAANQPLISGASMVSIMGGARIELAHVGIKPHASGSTGMAVDCRNLSHSQFHDIAFIENGSATFDLGFALHAQDAGPNIHCYYNVFERIFVVPTVTGTRLPVNEVFRLTGNTGNHTIRRLVVAGPWPTSTRPAVNIGTYCRSNVLEDSHFEGLKLSGLNVVIGDNGYGTKIINCYFEDTGQPLYVAPEIETGSREWTIVERCSFAFNTIDAATTPSLISGVTFRDAYAFGSDSTVLAAIRKLRRPTYTVSLTADSGSITLDQNTLIYSIDDNRLVTVTGQLRVSAVNSPSGNVFFTLPVIPALGVEFISAGGVILYGHNNLGTNRLALRRQNTQNVVYLIQLDAATGNVVGAASLLKAGSLLDITFQYFAA